MLKRITSIIFGCCLMLIVYCQDKNIGDVVEVWGQEPEVVTTSPGAPPSDALVLFDGSSWEAWEHKNDGKPVKWNLVGGAGVVLPGSGYIQTKQSFGSCQLHIEWRAPMDTAGLTSQGRGNSGVFLQSNYEVQILDSYRNKTYNNGQAASIYKQHIPLVNATGPPGAWQIYDIIFTAPTFNDDETLENPAFFTVFHNGVLVQNHVDVKGVTVNKGKPYYEKHGPRPLSLQDHGNTMAFRNIWIREL